jgi:hypothetical protein
MTADELLYLALHGLPAERDMASEELRDRGISPDPHHWN